MKVWSIIIYTAHTGLALGFFLLESSKESKG